MPSAGLLVVESPSWRSSSFEKFAVEEQFLNCSFFTFRPSFLDPLRGGTLFTHCYMRSFFLRFRCFACLILFRFFFHCFFSTHPSSKGHHCPGDCSYIEQNCLLTSEFFVYFFYVFPSCPLLVGLRLRFDLVFGTWVFHDGGVIMLIQLLWRKDDTGPGSQPWNINIEIS